MRVNVERVESVERVERIGRVDCVIPARLNSSRFPAKLLQPLAGKPVLLHTLERARAADCFTEVVCLADSPEIFDRVAAAGFRCVLTGPADNGTDRIARNLESIGSDLIVNLQGDEPVFPLEPLRALARALAQDPASAHVLVHEQAPSPEDMANPNRCKAGLDERGYIVDFYRRRPRASIFASRMQMGAYGYSKEFLRKYGTRPPSELEILESHEMLRDLALAPVRAWAVQGRSQAVDVPEDLDAALALYSASRILPDVLSSREG